MDDPSIIRVVTPGVLPILVTSIPIIEPSVVTLRVRASLDPDSKLWHRVVVINLVGGILTVVGVTDEFPPVATLGAAAWDVTALLVGLLLQPSVLAVAGVEFLVGWEISTL